MEQTSQPKDNIFSKQSLNTVQASDLETCAETHNFSSKKIKNNKMWAAHHRIFDKQFFCQEKSNLLFEWTEISFFRQCLRNASDNKHLGNDLTTPAGNTEPFPDVKITKLEQRAIETLINNSLVKGRAFYRLNERFVSNKTGDIIFSTRICIQ